MKVLERAVEIHRKTNAAARAAAAPIRRVLPPRDAMLSITAMAILRLVLTRLIQSAAAMAEEFLYPREPRAAVLRLVRKET